jgi:hypothetical protein
MLEKCRGKFFLRNRIAREPNNELWKFIAIGEQYRFASSDQAECKSNEAMRSYNS